MTYDMKDQLLAALADPTRRKIFEALVGVPTPVGVLAKTIPVSRPAISQHLKVLNDAGLVTVRQEGTKRIYVARPEALASLRQWLDQYWTDVLAGFANEVIATKENNDD